MDKDIKVEEIPQNCTDYDWELYFRITSLIVPNLLRQARERDIAYIVKGGKAVDAYLKNPIGSPDWDLAVHDYEPLYSFLLNGLKSIPSISKSISETTTVMDLGNKKFHGRQIGITNCGGMWVIDIMRMPGKDLRGVVIDGIPYMQLSSLIVDLEKTVTDRGRLVMQQKRFGMGDTEFLIQNKKKAAARVKEVSDKLLMNMMKACANTDPDKIEKCQRILKARLQDLNNAHEAEQVLNSRKTYESFIKERDKAEHVRTKFARTRARLTTLLAAVESNMELSPSYIRQLCEFCSTNQHASIMLSGKNQTPCSQILPHC